MPVNRHDNPLIQLSDQNYADDDPRKKPDSYFYFYSDLFGPLRNKEIYILELGVHSGSSLKIWHEYFNLGHIVGLDTAAPPENITTLLTSERVNYVQGDQSSEAALRAALEFTEGKGFDVIIDDASHIGILSRKSFAYLFKHGLKPGGLYFLEDYGTGYLPNWPDGRGVDMDSDPFERNPDSSSSHHHGMVGLIKQLVDELNDAYPQANERPRFDIQYIKMIMDLALIAKSSDVD